MSALNIEYLREYLQEVLPKHDGKLMTVSLSKNGKSAYVLIGFPELRYDVIRISNYKAYKTFFSHPTFSFYIENKPKFQLEISEYLSKSNRVKFNYQDYFVLKSIVCASNYNTSYFVDDSYLQFFSEETGIIFYQKSGFAKKKTHTSPLDEVVNQIFRKFYSDGLINTIEKGNGDIMVFVTALRMELLSTSEKNYQIKYLQDQCDINWRYITLPVSS